MSTPPAGWHPDPEGNQQLRYWDGQQWTSATQPMPPAQTPAPETPEQAKDRKRQLIAIGIIVAAIASIAIFKSIDFSSDDTETAAAGTTTTQAAPNTTSSQPPSTTRSYTVPPAARRTTESSSISDEEMAFRAGMLRIDFPYRSDIYQLIRKGRAACAEFDDGGTIASVGSGILGENPSWSEEEVGQLIGISIGAYCPEHQSLLPR